MKFTEIQKDVVQHYNINLDDPDSFQISDIDTTGWNIGPNNIEKYKLTALVKVLRLYLAGGLTSYFYKHIR